MRIPQFVYIRASHDQEICPRGDLFDQRGGDIVVEGNVLAWGVDGIYDAQSMLSTAGTVIKRRLLDAVLLDVNTMMRLSRTPDDSLSARKDTKANK